MHSITIHSTHVMGEPESKIRCPGSTPRFYTVRTCTKCEAETMGSAAGEFTDPCLLEPCNPDMGEDDHDHDITEFAQGKVGGTS